MHDGKNGTEIDGKSNQVGRRRKKKKNYRWSFFVSLWFRIKTFRRLITNEIVSFTFPPSLALNLRLYLFSFENTDELYNGPYQGNGRNYTL